MNVHLLGIGTARPPGRVSQADAASMAARRCCRDEKQVRALANLYRRTTVEHRGICLLRDGDGVTGVDWFYPAAADGETAVFDPGPTTGQRMTQFARLAPGLAEPAARAALDDAAVPATAITHLITTTCTGFAAPGVELAVMDRLGLSRQVKRVHIGFMGCHAALNGLQVAHAIARAEASARVLVLSVELGSLHFQYGWHAQRVLANALFADGAAALVIGQGSSPGARAWQLIDTASCLIDDTADLMSWHIADHGFVMSLSPRVPGVLATHLRPWLDGWLDRHGLTVPHVGSWAIHAGGPRIVLAVAEGLGLDASAVEHAQHVLRSGGNTSSATVIFILEQMRDHDAALPCVALSFGPGLVAESALFAGE